MNFSQIRTRLGKKEDCENIFQLYQELLESEKIEPDQIIDQNVFTNEGFGPKPCFEILVAEIEENQEIQIVGFALYFFHYAMVSGRSIFVECLYIKPSYQGRGYGTQLWKNLIQVGLEKNCSRCMFMVFGWNKKALQFYAKCGAVDWTIEKDEHCLHIPKADMIKFIS